MMMMIIMMKMTTMLINMMPRVAMTIILVFLC